ncbi:uncharacterized protein GGS22DRAFT_175204 [Annulohypoxylon maeteangense]|uniref:uncharacterized protein n=1 Tax=Annulohypoxylon maeteangense TaxID=1927788 RepID=UPI00200816B9|nr:uncharacterized protein GGS22DRAFT_175204 [Annulohypoxylon maeteangense]KAI0880406.1 hypothetical protein GGS22DRAFT_175204 [Annulohypoxylon maeteangense]
MSTGEEYHHPTTGSETRAPKAAYSNGHYSDYDKSYNKLSTDDGCGSTHEYKSPYKSMLNPRVHESQERSHRRRVRRRQDDGQAYCHELGELYTDNSMKLETLPNTDYVSRWDLPLTPTDSSNAYQIADPHIMLEPWNFSQEDKEEFGQEFELTAEEDLISAAKFYNEMTSPIGDSGTSSFPVPNFMARTEISVESYYSCRGVDGSNLPAAAYEFSDKRMTTNSMGVSPLDPASSMIVHTGHSLEGLLPDSGDHANLTVASKRKRICQLLGL